MFNSRLLSRYKAAPNAIATSSTSWNLQAQHERMGVLSEQEAQFLLDEYVKESECKVRSGSEKPLRFATE
jgi:hypothetical protein